MNTAILPFNPIQSAVAKSMAFVISKKNRSSRLANFPYATAFFRFYLGTAYPDVTRLKQVVVSYKNKQQAMNAVEQLIASNGEHGWEIDSVIAKQAFPSRYVFCSNSRMENHSELKTLQDSRVDTKQKHRRTERVEAYKQALLHCQCAELHRWIDSTAAELNSYEQTTLLEDWFNLHCDTAQYSWYELYLLTNMTPTEIAIDLAYGDYIKRG